MAGPDCRGRPLCFRRMGAAMKVTVNGQPMELPDGVSVEDLLGRLAVRREFTAVAVNREVTPRARYAATTLRDGDRVERQVSYLRYLELSRATNSLDRFAAFGYRDLAIGTGGLGSPIAMYLAAAGIDADAPDMGCCGMAGSFGFEKEHYDISMALAERRIAPAVRALPPDAMIIAPGVSCRQQITHATGRQPLHPAEVLQQALTRTT